MIWRVDYNDNVLHRIIYAFLFWSCLSTRIKTISEEKNAVWAIMLRCYSSSRTNRRVNLFYSHILLCINYDRTAEWRYIDQMRMEFWHIIPCTVACQQMGYAVYILLE